MMVVHMLQVLPEQMVRDMPVVDLCMLVPVVAVEVPVKPEHKEIFR